MFASSVMSQGTQCTGNKFNKSERDAIIFKGVKGITVSSEIYPAKNDSIADTNAKIKQCQDILKKTRGIYKGSKNKTTNKVSMNKTFEESMGALATLSKIRGDYERGIISFSDKIIASVTQQSGNCGEMNWVLFSLLNNAGLKPKLWEMVDKCNGRFDHVLCEVEINEKAYYVDAWANVFCEKDEFQDKIINKAKAWEDSNKFIINAISENEIYNFIKYKDAGYLGSHMVNSNDIRNLSISEWYSNIRANAILGPEHYHNLFAKHPNLKN